MALLDTLHDTFHRPRTAAYRRMERFVHALIMLSIVVLIAELILARGVWYERLVHLDLTPVTLVGRGIGAVLMVGGMFTLALFAGIVGHSILHAVLSIREEQFRMSDYVGHIIVCGYEEGDSLLLDTLAEDIDLDVKRVVLFAPGDRPADLPPAFLWVRGDPTKASELDKVRLSHASTVIISGERRIPPQLADAKTILIAFTIRSVMKRLALISERVKPMYVVAQQQLSRTHKALLIGVVDPATGHDILNPGDDFTLMPTHRTVYLAAAPVPELA